MECDWVKEHVLQLGRVLWFFIELGFNSPTSFSLFQILQLSKFFVGSKIKKLICIIFVHTCHFVKIENQHIHN